MEEIVRKYSELGQGTLHAREMQVLHNLSQVRALKSLLIFLSSSEFILQSLTWKFNVSKQP